MKFLLKLSLSIVLMFAYVFCSKQNDLNFCKKTHRGVLQYHQKNDTNGYITVAVALKDDTLRLYQGTKLFSSINLKDVIAPLEIFSTSPECLTVNIINNDSVILCCNTEECINNWWVFLTKQILCFNQGEMRNENDDNIIEYHQDKILNDNFDGVSININEDLEDIPDVSIKAES
ncbi:conserved protein, unknown function [Hepatocystis sp. ex Piliocolobus tephrosceles]|nr:conserved protein, unknown function [Hepatocystis sp. ex Piliocolobus tephrosceles]